MTETSFVPEGYQEQQWKISEAIPLDEEGSSFLNVDLNQSTFERTLLAVAEATGMDRAKAEDLLKNNKLEVKFGNAGQAVNDAFKTDGISSQAVVKLATVLHKAGGSVYQMEDGRIQLTIDPLAIKEKLPKLLEQDYNTSYSALSKEAQTVALKTAMKRIALHEMVHVLQWMDKPEAMHAGTRAAIFRIKAMLTGLAGAALNAPGAVQSHDLKSMALAGLAVGATTIVGNRINKEYNWVEGEAEAFEREKEEQIRDPFTYLQEETKSILPPLT